MKARTIRPLRLLGALLLLLQGAALTPIRESVGPDHRIEHANSRDGAVPGHQRHDATSAAALDPVIAASPGDCSHCTHSQCTTEQHCVAAGSLALPVLAAFLISPVPASAGPRAVFDLPVSASPAPPSPPPQALL
ncbi:MAG: hypothetical protein H0T44_01260 [Gemmatimonadales bacterium]|nr:hypothetical protein [Gemmatimonadales bacterium]